MILKKYSKIESTNIEYKEKVEYGKPKSWLKTVSAFANSSNGGILVFGVRDTDREGVGLSNIIKDSEKITELINSKIKPIPRFELNAFSENNKDFLEVKVGDGPKTPYYYENDGRKEAFIRNGNQTISAPKYTLDSLILKGQNTTYDELPSIYDLNDVKFGTLCFIFKKECGIELNPNKDYYSMELISNDNKVTNAGLLLSDNNILKHSRIFCTRWKGLVKGSVDGDAIDDKEYYGSLISLLKNAEVFIKNNSHIGWKIEGMKRVEKSDYPLIAVREAIVNAIIHRDYQIIGSEIHIDMFDDRLEITSPGGMMDGSFIQQLDITMISSMRRNRVISDVFNRLHFMERRGSGLTRIIESYKDSNIKPMFFSDISFFKVVLPNKSYICDESKDNELQTNVNVINDEDYFIMKFYKNISGNLQKRTYTQIKLLFNKFTYNYEFKREDVEKLLNVKKTRANDIISLLVKSDLVVQISYLSYKFKK